MTIQSKQILSATGYLSISFSFKISHFKKSYSTHGKSKITKNVKAHYKKLMNHAIWDGVVKIFPQRSKYYNTIDVHSVKLYDYNITYYISRYEIIDRKNKKGIVRVEKWRDTEAKRTRYSVISNSKEYLPEQEV
jgi:hypothetical protein